MKKTLLILVQLLICTYLAGQTAAKPALLTNSTSMNRSGTAVKNISLKSYLIARKEYKKSTQGRYTPNFSLDLLDGKGIHLFSISKMGPIPSMNVGARIKAGITISI